MNDLGFRWRGTVLSRAEVLATLSWAFLIIEGFDVQTVFYSGMAYGLIGFVQFAIGWYYGWKIDAAAKISA